MASNFLGINRGQTDNPGNVATGAATTGTDIELRIDTGKGTTKEDVVKALRAIEGFILGNWIPAGNPGVNQPPL